ncbi:MAG: hypothetical protein IJB82_05125 [Bacilli bacterium]|nr:hypothetical protein [Bacilli bacterium]
MNKKKIISIVISLVILIVFFISYGIYISVKEKNNNINKDIKEESSENDKNNDEENKLYETSLSTLKEQILLDNDAKSDKFIDFNYNSEGCSEFDYGQDKCLNFDENQVTNGLYYTADETLDLYGEDGKRIYYFRGDVDNNWVSFADYKWRIVRTTKDNGVKILYSGDGKSKENVFIAENVIFNKVPEYKYELYHDGYTYNSDLNGYYGKQADSSIKKVIDAWFYGNKTFDQECDGKDCDFTNNSSKLSDYQSYLSQTAIYCQDRSAIDIKYNSNSEYALWVNYNRGSRPTFACPEKNASRYTVDSSGGNGYLDNSIALLTIDEVNYSGIILKRKKTSSAYMFDNISNQALMWWTMSPFGGYRTTMYHLSILTVHGSGTSSSSISNRNSVRPVVSLKSCVTVVSGNGSFESPYEVSDSKC